MASNNLLLGKALLSTENKTAISGKFVAPFEDRVTYTETVYTTVAKGVNHGQD